MLIFCNNISKQKHVGSVACYLRDHDYVGQVTARANRRDREITMRLL